MFLKEGAIKTTRTIVPPLMRSIDKKTEPKLTSFAGIERVPGDQTGIYYLAGDSREVE